MDPITLVALVAAAALAGVIVGYIVGRVWPRPRWDHPRRSYRVTVTAGVDDPDEVR